jgi:hypothetical protein
MVNSAYQIGRITETLQSGSGNSSEVSFSFNFPAISEQGNYSSDNYLQGGSWLQSYVLSFPYIKPIYAYSIKFVSTTLQSGKFNTSTLAGNIEFPSITTGKGDKNLFGLSYLQSFLVVPEGVPAYIEDFGGAVLRQLSETKSFLAFIFVGLMLWTKHRYL